MTNPTDQQLLRDYTERRSEAAFAELVHRHVDLVYSAARRMVCDAHLAEDVTQGVFVALARNAHQLTDHPVLAGWLHRSTQNIAAQTVRTEVRRRTREQESATMNKLLSAAPDANWEDIAPHLDAALGELNETDREALLLRYFQRQSAREIGQTLGLSDEAAQKRVNRAMERHRAIFTKRGVTIGASALVVLISVNAVQSAPIALCTTIAGTVTIAPTSAATGTATVTATKALAMTTLQKSLVTAAIVATIGTSLYEARRASNSEIQVQSLRHQQQLSLNQIEQLRKERDAALNGIATLKEEKQQWRRGSTELPRLRGEVTKMRRDLKELAASSAAGDDPFVQKALKWKANEARLRQLFEDQPNQRIPEMELLPEDAWLDLARDEDLDSEPGIRKALSGVRRYAKNIFVNDLSDALQKYVEKNDGSLPTDILQLKPYFKKPVDDALLQPYKLLHTGKVSDMQGQWAITDTVVDAEYDTPWGISPGSYGPTRGSSETLTTLTSRLDSAIKEFSDANNGKTPEELDQLIPHIKTPAQTNALEQLSRMNVRLDQKYRNIDCSTFFRRSFHHGTLFLPNTFQTSPCSPI